jgi:nitroreductase
VVVVTESAPMDVFEAISTTRAMRRLDPDREVSDADLFKILEAANKGPSGSNSQPVRWVVARDPEIRKRLGAIYHDAWTPVRKYYTEAGPSTPERDRVLRSADHLGDHMGEASAIVIPCAQGEPGQVESSVYGCVQNLFLAARALGIGTTLTTVHRMREAEVKEVLGIPDDVNTWAMIPLGYPLGRWGEAKRLPVREVTYWDGWRKPPPAEA